MTWNSLPGRCHTHQVWPQAPEERARSFFLQYQSKHRTHKHTAGWTSWLEHQDTMHAFCHYFFFLLLIGGQGSKSNLLVKCTVEIPIKFPDVNTGLFSWCGVGPLCVHVYNLVFLIFIFFILSYCIPLSVLACIFYICSIKRFKTSFNCLTLCYTRTKKSPW